MSWLWVLVGLVVAVGLVLLRAWLEALGDRPVKRKLRETERDMEALRLHWNNVSKRHAEEMERVKAVLDPIVEQHVRIRPRRLDYNTFVLQVGFSDQMVWENFVHGDSREAVRYFAKRIARQIEREMCSLNFMRLAPYEADPRLRRVEQMPYAPGRREPL